MLRIGVVVFPGTNCEFDTAAAIERCGGQPELVWHDRRSLVAFDALILPGGFSYGDYLRPGAIARFSPVMAAVRSFADSGGPVLGICNGFQVLTEAGMLPGALQKNVGLKFICRTVAVRIETSRTPVTREIVRNKELNLPINHFEGNYTCDLNTLEKLRGEDRIVMRYVNNPNGSMDSIAGICNEAGNVVGIMPHPERAVDHLLGLEDGRALFESLTNTT